jgi:hypothetical protein
MRLEDGIVYWEVCGRHKCGAQLVIKDELTRYASEMTSDCRCEDESLYFEPHPGGFVCR